MFIQSNDMVHLSLVSHSWWFFIQLLLIMIFIEVRTKLTEYDQKSTRLRSHHLTIHGFIWTSEHVKAKEPEVKTQDHVNPRLINPRCLVYIYKAFIHLRCVSIVAVDVAMGESLPSYFLRRCVRSLCPLRESCRCDGVSETRKQYYIILYIYIY